MLLPRAFLTLLCFVGSVSYSCPGMALNLEQQRQIFLNTEKQAAKLSEKQFKQTAVKLKGYALLPYLYYLRLKDNLQKTSAILMFLQQHQDSRYAGLLHSRWMRYLAKKQHWKTFLKYYRNTSNTRLSCHYHWAQWQQGQRKQALEGAKKLWLVGVSQPKACDALFREFVESPAFTNKMIWMRFQLALENRKVRLANYIKRLLNTRDQKIADFWIKVHKQPELVLKPKYWNRRKPHYGLIYAHGIQRLARTQLETAIHHWDSHKTRFKIDAHHISQLERNLALSLAFKKSEDAFPRLKNLQNKDHTVIEWLVRAALINQDWSQVDEALKYLPKEWQQKEKWRYWQGRVFAQNNKTLEAQQLFKELAKERSYYGFLAANSLQLDLQLRDHPLKISAQQIADLLALKPFKMVQELNELDRPQEAKYNWWHALRSVDVDQKVVAAKLAEKWGWQQIAIFTVARAKHWDDVKLRFPIAYSEQVKKYAKKQQLDAAIVFGLIRRESAFEQKAISPVGARGLMQIMPRTGRQIARDLKERWRSKNSLFNAETNVRYGTYYYKKLLDKFSGNIALAAAAYNAGPQRVNKWLPENTNIPADIWIETIPFSETREYVSAVLSYAMIYQQRLGWNTLKFSDFLRDISPHPN